MGDVAGMFPESEFDRGYRGRGLGAMAGAGMKPQRGNTPQRWMALRSAVYELGWWEEVVRELRNRLGEGEGGDGDV